MSGLVWLGFFFFEHASSEGHVRGGGGGAAFPVFVAVVIVEGKVEGPPDEDQDQGQDAVVGHVKTGKRKKAVIGRIFRIVINRNAASGFHGIVNRSQRFYKAVAHQEVHLAGLDQLSFSKKVQLFMAGSIP